MDDFQPRARIIADSVSEHGARLTTFEVSLHRFMLPEFNTHRTFSRNSASSRAIPVAKTMRRIADEPAVPLAWRSEQKGMQGGDVLPATQADAARRTWLDARDAAVAHAETLVNLGVHKSIVNRLLEPFMSHTIVVTATDYDGFFAQRAPGPDGTTLAQPEIAYPAALMKVAYHKSIPEKVTLGGWHTPYVQDWERRTNPADVIRKVSAARCARVSYLNHNGRRDIEQDINLFERLVTAQPPHASPLEHIATPAAPFEGTLGNLDGWHQLRHMYETDQ